MVEDAIWSECTDIEQKDQAARMLAGATSCNKRCVKLFGVNIMETMPEETKRKSDSGVSAGLRDSQTSSEKFEAPRKRRKGVPWTEEEHLRFLAGLQELGRGDWKGISRSFVKTKTPTQVASHAQKHFLRQATRNMKNRRQSVFDIPFDPKTRNAQDIQKDFPSYETPRLPPPEACTSTSPCPNTCTSTNTSTNTNTNTIANSSVLQLRTIPTDQAQANNAQLEITSPFQNCMGYCPIIRGLGPFYEVQTLIVPMGIEYVRRDRI